MGHPARKRLRCGVCYRMEDGRERSRVLTRDAHLSDDEAVAKMGHPERGGSERREGDCYGSLSAGEVGQVAGVGPVFRFVDETAGDGVAVDVA